MSPVFDCSEPEARNEALTTATDAILRGECVVMPTDTVYGIAADAFNAAAVGQLLEAKGRGREMPPPVLIPSEQTVDGLAMSVPSYARRLMTAFWPGGLTLVLRVQQSLAWDLGDTNGTVALRVPDDEIARELLHRTGPLAVSSANRTGKPSATTVTEAGFMLGHYVDIYLDGGERGADTSSTILDCTTADPVVLREGTISDDELRTVLGDVELVSGRAINSVVPPDEFDEVEPDGPAAEEPEQHEPVDLAKAADEPEKPDEPDEFAQSATVSEPAESGQPATLGEQWDVAERPVPDEPAQSTSPDHRS